MFEHSVKVPRHYKVAANIFKKVSTEGGSIKTLLYDEKLRHFRTNVLFALLTETIKHADQLDKIFVSCSILNNEPRLDPWLAKVLAAELLFGKKALPGKSKPEQTILSYKEQFEKYATDHQDDLKTEGPARRPRYVRINTNLLTTSDAIRAFQDEGYRFIRCTSGSYEDYLKQIQELTEYDFTQDYHVKTMFVFSSGTKFHEHDLYLENKIILQDKATALAVHVLAPPPGSIILDMCAAPGMKTTQTAAYIRNQGKIYAVERNEKRYQTLCDFVEKTESKCVEPLHKDSLEIRRGEYEDVEYILLDPSCSGSGMEFSVHNYIEDTRLAKLTSLQEKFLKHAMNAFPKAKRIVYSTCSLFPEENERVITNVVKASRAKWRVQDIKEILKGQWNNFGSGMYGSMGAKCLYARPDSDFTTGFFLAVLDRDLKDMEKQQNKQLEKEQEDVEKGSSKKKRKESEAENQIEEVTEEVPKKKKKKKDRSKVHDVDNTNDDAVDEINTVEEGSKAEEVAPKKKKKKKDKGEVGDENGINIDEAVEEGSKKKKKRKENIIELDDEEEVQLIDAPSTDQADEVVKKKKKKNKDLDNIDLTNEVDIPNGKEIISIDDEVVPKKKKKKRDKHTAEV